LHGANDEKTELLNIFDDYATALLRHLSSTLLLSLALTNLCWILIVSFFYIVNSARRHFTPMAVAWWR
jgi:hypothetical protein